MVDNVNPTSQFHPYQPERSTPQADRFSRSGLGGILENLKNVDVRGQLGKARRMAQNNPGMVLGGLAALVIGAGLMRKRSM
jgi:LPXTG-motif cell wall-anchored protein